MRLKYNNFDSSFAMRGKYYSAMGGTGTYTGSSTQNKFMLKEMKAHAFAKGGTIGNLVKASGEDGFVLARTGEEILSLEKISALGKAFAYMNPMVDSIKSLSKVYVPKGLSNAAMNAQITIGDIQMYGVNDPETFANQMKDVLKNDTSKVMTVIKTAAYGQILNKPSVITRKL